MISYFLLCIAPSPKKSNLRKKLKKKKMNKEYFFSSSVILNVYNVIALRVSLYEK